MICIGRHVGGHALALQHGGQNYFLLISCSTFHSYAQMCCKRYHIIFSTFSLKFKCKICVQREVIHNFFLKKTFGHVTIYELIHFKTTELLDMGIIEPVEGPAPWVNPLVIVTKTKGEIRLCVDMRQTNQAIM